MRKLTAALILTTIVAGGAYGYYWSKQAEAFKTSVEQYLTQANDQFKALNKGAPVVAYESITTSGFPFTVQVDIAKPVIDLPLSDLLQVVSHTNKAVPPMPPSKDNVRVKVAYSDKISLTSNMLFDHFSAALSGDTTVTPTINDTAREAITTSQSTPAVCHLTINHPATMPASVTEVVSDTDMFFDIFRSISCDMGNSITKSATTAQVLSTMDSLHVALSSEPIDTKSKHITIHSDMRNVKATPAYDAMVTSYMPLFYDMMGVPQSQRNASVEVSQLGSQNSLIDATYEGPIDQKDILDPSSNIKLDVQALNSKNALYEANNEAHVVSTIQDGERHTTLVLHSNMTATEQYVEAITKALTQFIDEAQKNPNQKNIIQNLPANVKPEALAAALIPKLQNAGKIQFDADIKAVGNKDSEHFDIKNLTVNGLSLATEKEGLKLKGDGTWNSTPSIPVGTLQVTCVSCDTLVDDIGAYSIGVDSVVAPTRPGQVHYVTPQLVEGVKQFLHAISEHPADKAEKDLDVQLVSDNTGKITVSGKQLMEVIGLFGVNVGQNLQHVEEPAKPATAAPEAGGANAATPAPAAPAATPAPAVPQQPKAEEPAKPETAAPAK